MSTKTAAPLKDEQIAHLVNTVRIPAFLQKLAADYNIHPQCQEDVAQLCEMAGTLRAAQAQQVKQASGGNRFLSEALDGLKTVLRQEGHPVAPLSNERWLKQAAEKALNEDPALMSAATAYAQQLLGIEMAAGV